MDDDLHNAIVTQTERMARLEAINEQQMVTLDKIAQAFGSFEGECHTKHQSLDGRVSKLEGRLWDNPDGQGRRSE